LRVFSPEDPLRKDLEKLLESIALELWVSPSVQQITIMNSFLYEGPLAPAAMRRDIRRPYGDYVFIMGVYGAGILKGFLKEPEADYTSTLGVSQVVKNVEKILFEGLEKLREKYGKNGMLYCVGHAHIDAAWLWPRA